MWMCHYMYKKIKKLGKIICCSQIVSTLKLQTDKMLQFL